MTAEDDGGGKKKAAGRVGSCTMKMEGMGRKLKSGLSERGELEEKEGLRKVKVKEGV